MKLELLPPVNKDLWRIGWGMRKKIKRDFFPVILQNPDGDGVHSFEYKDNKLCGFHFSEGKKNYRILYKIFDNTVFVIMVGLRKTFSSESEEFFKELDKRLEFLEKNF